MMKRLINLFTVAAVLIAAGKISAGPERIDAKESKVVQQAAVEQPCRWTGFYIGGHGGYAWGGDMSFQEVTPPNLFFDEPFNFNDRNGFIGGGQVGFNLQLGTMFVIGVEGTFSGGDLNDKTTSTFIGGTTPETEGKLDTNWIATVGGRLGVTFWQNRVLFYGKGGVAFTDYDFNTREIGDNGVFHFDDNETMPLVGVGIEYAFTCHWSVRVEYNHLFSEDNRDVTGTETDPPDHFDTTFRLRRGDWDTVTAGINFKF
jgi:outer membrane immunogenic protein